MSDIKILRFAVKIQKITSKFIKKIMKIQNKVMK